MGICQTGALATDHENVEVQLQAKPVIIQGNIGRSQFIHNQKGSIRDTYDILDKIGEGAFGYVSKAQNRTTNAVRAVKTLPCRTEEEYEFANQEIDIMKQMDHPNITNLFETYEDIDEPYWPTKVHLVMELCDGGPLKDRVKAAGRLTELQTAIAMEQILRAVFYMHNHHVVHRDLKPENFLLMSCGPLDRNNVVKVIDFGIACHYEPGEHLTQKVGTALYAAPQVFKGWYDNKCDLWSCGVNMFFLLSGHQPFAGKRQAAVVNRVIQGYWRFSGAQWGSVSKVAKDLIVSLLKASPVERPTAEQALKNEWFKRATPKSVNGQTQHSIVEHLSSFQTEHALKKAGLEIIARQLNENEIQGLREFFITLDTNKDGLLTLEELDNGLEQRGFQKTKAELQQIMSSVDIDGNGVIGYTEFLAAALDRKKHLAEQICWKAFNVLDVDGDGKISEEELKCTFNSERLKKDGIDFQDFMEVMRTGSSSKDKNNSTHPIPKWLIRILAIVVQSHIGEAWIE